MNAFIQQNKKLLKFYYTALRLSGWILLTLGVSSSAIKIVLARTLGARALGVISINMPLRNLFLFGLLGLGIAQFIQYISDLNSKPGFILRHGNKFLYAYAILIFILMVFRNIYGAQHLFDTHIKNTELLYYSSSIASLVLFAAKALILIGTAQFLKRIIPIIEEHKSLV